MKPRFARPENKPQKIEQNGGENGREPMATQYRTKTSDVRKADAGLYSNQRHSRADFDHLLGMIQLNMFDCKQDPVEQ
ncbi:hypothetical protein [Amaricoccus macauensis]|uniref:hypothetical protein n=1 Tax=Amaricoccus macauensis TaxID=57001 RepID=UPI003C797BB5